MTEGAQHDAAELRAMGIGHPSIHDDAELVEIVEMLLDLGVELDDMAGNDITFLGAPLMIRPDATIEPGEVFPRAQAEADFRARAAVALGYNIDEDAQLLTPAEVDTVEFFDVMREVVGEDDLLAMMRVMGGSMARLSRTVSVVNGAHASARFESIGTRKLSGISEPVELFQLM